MDVPWRVWVKMYCHVALGSYNLRFHSCWYLPSRPVSKNVCFLSLWDKYREHAWVSCLLGSNWVEEIRWRVSIIYPAPSGIYNDGRAEGLFWSPCVNCYSHDFTSDRRSRLDSWMCHLVWPEGNCSGSPRLSSSVSQVGVIIAPSLGDS